MRFRLVLILLTALISAEAQQLDPEKWKGLSPRSLGPAAMSGRITAIDVVANNHDIIFAGAASGGVWKSTSGGVTWEPVFDKEKVLSIGAIAIQQSNPSVVWVGTGEGNPRNSLNGGNGIYRSLDGGKTWSHLGLEKTRHIHRIIIDPTNPQIVYVGVMGSPWGDHPERGVYKTIDGGVTWTRILFTNERSGCGDLVMDPSNPNKLIAGMWEHRRQPWFFKSGGPGSGVHITWDGGKTWKKLSDKEGLPKGELGRSGLAISRSNPNIMYALIENEKNGLYRSENGGANWTFVRDANDGNVSSRPFYFWEIYVDPANENRIYSLHTFITLSEDGGKNFRMLAGWKVHLDHHAFWIDPNDPDFIVDGNDGGLNISHDRGNTWEFIDNLPVGQFYHVNVDMEHPYNVYGGMQDNGSWAGPAYVWRNSGIRNSYWQEISFGDGFDVSPDPADSRFGYTMSQEGYLSRYDKSTGYNAYIRPTHPDAGKFLRFNWNSGLAQDPFSKTTIYYGSQFLHKSTDRGNTWSIISPDLTTNNPAKLKQGESGGITMDATGAENHCTILAIAPSSKQEGVIWVGTDDGKVQLTTNGGKSWTDVTPAITGMPANAWVPQIRASEFTAGEAFVVVNNYRQFDYKPYLFRTKDFGKTWESLVTPTQVGESNYTLCVVQDPVERKLLFLGTENGLWVTVDEGKTWTRWTNDYPTGVPTIDMVIHPREHDLVIATFGRALYVLDDIRPLREVAAKGTALLSKGLVAFAPPKAYLAEYQQPTGPRFDADAVFNGKNRPFGALLTYAINRPEKKADVKAVAAKSETKVAYDTLQIEIFNAEKVKIRTLKFKAPEENGIFRTTWNLTEKGVARPGRDMKRSSREFEGLTVLPGSYKLRFLLGDLKDSVTLEVADDPRFNTSSATLAERNKWLRHLQDSRRLAGEALIQLNEARTLLNDYETRIGKRAEEPYKSVLDQTKALKDSVNAILDFITGKEDKRQGILMEQRTPLSYLDVASGYVGGSRDPINETDKRVIEHADKKLAEILTRVNNFFSTSWATYRSAAGKLTLDGFKDYPQLKKTP